MARKRVVITGMGLVSCLGTDVEAFYQALLEGRSGIVPIIEFPCGEYPTRFAGAIRNFDTGDYIEKKQARRVDPFTRFAMVAGKKALEMAGLDATHLGKIDKTRAGIVIGSGMGGMKVFSDGVETLITKGYNRLTPFFVPFIITNMAGALLAIDIGFMGPNYSISTACATSNYSIHNAAEHIRRGDADIMLCGGAEASITPIGLAGFVVIGALSTRNEDPAKASRPWDKNRDGFVLGEGSGVLVLESLEHAQARNAPIFAEYLGGALTCDADHITTPREDGQGIILCMEKAIKDAGLEPKDINYINAHATSTPAGDMGEVAAIQKVFGPYTSQIKMNATKSMIGHCLGAAGGIEAIATIQAIRTGMLHPTINITDPEPGLGDIDIVANVAQPLKVKAALSNSFGFGGHNSSIILAPFKP